MNMIAFEADYENVESEFDADWIKPAWRILNEYRYGPQEFLSEFGESGRDLIDGLISEDLNDPDDNVTEDLMNRRIDDFFADVAYHVRRRRKMGVVLGDVDRGEE